MLYWVKNNGGGEHVELRELLGVRSGVTALIGGGGKTAMMYTLARELAAHGTVICTTTTRILPPDHLPVLERVDRAALERTCCVCAGRPAAGGKLAAPAQSVGELAALADCVLAEADGSRGLPVKAHLPHEPVIPAEAGLTVVLVGASGFGRPIREAVHRWERFCALTGAPPEALVTAEYLAAALEAEKFGDLIFINQAETPEQMAEAQRLAALLDRPVFAGALKGGVWNACHNTGRR